MNTCRTFVFLCSILVLAGCTTLEDAAFFIPEFDEERHALMTTRLTTACDSSASNPRDCGEPVPACLGNGCRTVRMGAVRDGSRCASFLNTAEDHVVLTVRTYWGEQTRMLKGGEIYDFYFGPGCLTPDRVRSTIVFYRYD